MSEPNIVTEAPKKSRLKSGCLIALGIVVGLGVLGSIVGDGKPASSGSSAQAGANAPDTSAAPPPVKATAREIFAAYENNQLAAAKLYADKTLAVTGTVQKIDEAFGEPVLALATSNQYMPLRAYFPKDAADQLATLSPGAKLTVICEQVQETGGFLALKDCKLDPVP